MVESEAYLAWHKPKFSIFGFRFLNNFVVLIVVASGTDVYDHRGTVVLCYLSTYFILEL